MKKPLILLCLLFIRVMALAQQTDLDSLQAALPTVKDTAKVKLLLEISKVYLQSNQQQAIRFAEKAKDLANETKFPRGAAYALKNIGMAYYVQGKFQEVLPFWQKSLEVFTELDDKKGMGNLMGNIGAVYFTLGNDVNALRYHLKALQIGEEIGDKRRMASTMGNIGAVYFNNPATHDKALLYYTKALRLEEEIGFKSGIGANLINIGEVHQVRGELEKALAYSFKSLEALEEAGDQGKIAYALNNIAKVYAKQGNNEKALDYHRQAFKIARAEAAKLEMTQSLVGLGKVQQTMGNFKISLGTYQQAATLAEELGASKELKDAYEGIATAYGKLGDYRNGYEYRLLLSGVKDQIYNTESLKNLANLQANYENEKQQAQIELLTKDRELQRANLQRQRMVRNALLLGLGLILIIACTLYFNSRNRAKSNLLLKRKNVEINRQKEELADQRDSLSITYDNLVKTQAQLIQAEKMASLGELTAGIAHEIQNPLNFVNNFSEVSAELVDELEEEYQADNKEEVLALAADLKQNLIKIRHHGRRADAIVKGMLQHTQATVGERQLVNLNALTEEYLRLAYHGQRAKQNDFTCTINTQYDPGVEQVEVVPQGIGQVLVNIYNNAFYAMQQRQKLVPQAADGEEETYQPTLTVTTRRKAGKVEILVRDNGMGIPESVKSKIFQPFFTTKPTGQGTGLGLSLSYEIISQGHDGELQVKSEEGKFTEFGILLPVRKAHPQLMNEAHSVA